MIKEAKKHLESKEMKNVLVFGNPEWKPSLLGLVAGSFSDEHGRPAFFWGREGSNSKENKEAIIKGSCRSGSDVHVVELLERVKDIMLDFGGHAGAGGFSLLQENIHSLEERLNSAYLEVSKKKKKTEEIFVDKKATLDEINWETWKEIEKFAPFGYENPKPAFLFEDIEIQNVRLFGKENNHLELKFKNSGGKEISAIAFFQNGNRFEADLENGNKVNLVATMEKSVFRNYPELRLRIVDIF
jgi:single-stranded-DNA-specific exonuclease